MGSVPVLFVDGEGQDLLSGSGETESRRRGLAGNQPFLTRSRCSRTSRIDQKHEKAVTPQRIDHTPDVMSEAASIAMPPKRKSQLHFWPR